MWTENQKMMINKKKTKTMIFNFTENLRFSTRLHIKDENIDIVDHTKLLGTIVSSDLGWNLNTSSIVKKANARMELLRRVAGFGTPVEDLKIIYILFVRSILEQSCVVWHSSLTEQNSSDLERVQKSATKIILQERFKNYKNALEQLEIEDLKSRREALCLDFAKKCTKHEKLKHLFPKNSKEHQMNTRNSEVYKVYHANTKRFQQSPIIFMQNLLNEDEKNRRND